MGTLIHFVCALNFCLALCFLFLLVLQSSQEKLTTMLVQNFEGQTRCVMEYVLLSY